MAARDARRLLIVLMIVGVYSCVSLSQYDDNDPAGEAVSPVGNLRPPLGSPVGDLRRATRSSTREPDISMVYSVLDRFPGRVDVYCVSGDQGQQVEGHLVPYYSSNPTVERQHNGTITFNWKEELTSVTARGVTCGAAGIHHYKVSAPLMNEKAAYVPDELSVTVSKGEDLRLRVTLNTPAASHQVMWQKEPPKRKKWQPSNLRDDNLLIIPPDYLTGSGFYSLTHFTNVGGQERNSIGTFSLLVRECPVDRYGEDCSNWCPDCMYGGACHPETGECVCPPYLSGDRCQTRCGKNMMGRDCTVELPAPRGKQVCLRHPLGCHCAPGFTGHRCNTMCGDHRWGVRCSQSCSHCQGHCDPQNGECHSGEPPACAGGDLGLPRLRQPPQVLNVQWNTVDVSFDDWKESYDDGATTTSDVVMYKLQLWITDQGKINELVNDVTPSQKNTVRDLQPGTEYSMQVLVQVLVSTDRGGQVCVADGTGRERVHTVTFNTPCPDVPLTPSGVNISEITNDSFLVTWQDFPYKTKCRLQYVLEVLEVQGTTSQHNPAKVLEEATFRVSGLQPFTEYNIRVFSIANTGTYSESPQPTTVRTLPQAPDPPQLSLTSATHQVVASWGSPAGAQGNVTYLYRYKKTLKFCNEELQTPNAWSGLMDESVTIMAGPYTQVEVRLRARNEGGESDVVTGSFDTLPAPPENKVENIVCSPDYAEHCSVTLENKCELVHGPDLHVDYLLRAVNISLREYDEPRDLSTPTLSTSPDASWTVNISLPRDLLPYTWYWIKAYPANAAGWNKSAGIADKFRTKPQAPGEVKMLRVQEAATTLTVTWDAPLDTPPRGQLEGFNVSWKQHRRYGTRQDQWDSSTVPANTTTYIIQNLTENIIYTIKVEAKNRDVDNYGPETVKTAKTTPGKPSPVRNLRELQVTTRSLQVTWEAPIDPAGDLVIYLTSARVVLGQATEEDVTHDVHTTADVTHDVNTTADVAQVEFTGVGAGVEVEVSVSACNSEQCSDRTVKRFWTKPEPPQVTSELQWVTATDNTITISLPTVSSFPVYQWVVVVRAAEDPESAEEVEMRARRLVRGPQEKTQDGAQKGTQEGTQDETQEETPEGTQEGTQEETPEGTQEGTQEGTHSSAGSEEWIAARIYQEAGNTTMEFVVGDGQVRGGYNNSQLQTGATYWLTVVTETTAGHHRELVVSTAQQFRAISPTLGVYLGVALALVLFMALTAFFMWRRRPLSKPSLTIYGDMDTSHYVPNGVLDNEHHSSHIGLQRLSVTSEAGGRPAKEDDVTPRIENVQEEEEVLEPPPAEGGYQNTSLVVTESEYANVSHRIPSSQVEAYLSRAIHSQDTALEFKSVAVYMDKTCLDGQREQHRRKNRYKNNLPYDDTRVRLPPLPDQPDSDYINASYIQGHSKAEAYIASQGPKDFNVDTIGDFWRMLWYTRCPAIIMVANLEENGKMKVAQYWPEKDQPLVKGDIEVKLISTEVQMDFVIRKMEISKMEEVRELKQFQYTAWPDHGVPQNPYGLAQMIKHITKVPSTGPITVHCSAGIGRTGTVLLVLVMLEQLNTSGYLDPHQALVLLRNARPRLVENIAQYIFGHQLLQEVLSGVKTSYTCGEFPGVVEDLRLPHPPSNTSIILQQFQKLKDMPKDLSFKFANDPKCAHLNRNVDILPADNRMVFLQNLGGGLETQYVNVVRVNGMDRKDAYLAGEHPQPHTMRDLWRLVYERRVPVWTLLHTLPPHHPDYPSVVPSEEPQTVGKLVIQMTGSRVFHNFTEYYVEITAPKSHSLACHKCVLLLMDGWPHSDLLPASPEPLLVVLERVEAISQSKSSSLFTCKDGVTGCGVMMALLQLVARMKLVQEVDVYRSVLSVIYDRPQFITSVEQFDFLHTAATCYLSAFSIYGNFN